MYDKEDRESIAGRSIYGRQYIFIIYVFISTDHTRAKPSLVVNRQTHPNPLRNDVDRRTPYGYVWMVLTEYSCWWRRHVGCFRACFRIYLFIFRFNSTNNQFHQFRKLEYRRRHRRRRKPYRCKYRVLLYSVWYCMYSTYILYGIVCSNSGTLVI